MKDSIKKNLPLIAGLAIPIIMIVAIALAVYVPRLFAPQPAFSFLYSSGDIYQTSYFFAIENEVLVKKDKPQPYGEIYYKPATAANLQLYLYNPAQNKSIPISLQDAQNLKLSAMKQSPDGYEVISGNQSENIFTAIFGGYNRGYNTQYLKGHNTAKKINLNFSGDPYNYYNFQFLGWIIK